MRARTKEFRNNRGGWASANNCDGTSEKNCLLQKLKHGDPALYEGKQEGLPEAETANLQSEVRGKGGR